MPRGKKTTLALPDKLAFEKIGGEPLVKIKTAAKLAGVHPVVLEMAHALLKDTNHGARFVLSGADMQRRAEEIDVLFRKGLKKVAKSMGQTVAVKSHRDGNALVFWYDTSGPGLHSKRPKA